MPSTLGRQPMTSQYFEPLALQTFALVAAAIHCTLSDYVTGKKATVMFSQMNIDVHLSIPYEKDYSGCHCTHRSHISGPLQTKTPPTPTMRRKLR